MRAALPPDTGIRGSSLSLSLFLASLFYSFSFTSVFFIVAAVFLSAVFLFVHSLSLSLLSSVPSSTLSLSGNLGLVSLSFSQDPVGDRHYWVTALQLLSNIPIPRFETKTL